MRLVVPTGATGRAASVLARNAERRRHIYDYGTNPDTGREYEQLTLEYSLYQIGGQGQG
jgi:hypothetical protein